MTEFRHDMTGMFLIHDALRRDLARAVESNARGDGWMFFETMLLMHHEIEDEMLWPLARQDVPGRPDDINLLDQMVDEHAVIRPLLERLDGALAHGEPTEAARSDLERMSSGTWPTRSSTRCRCSTGR